tara:strand:- start:501 stop:740 length:240 start_codon:yes stop_codon:yes gene_type:complete
MTDDAVDHPAHYNLHENGIECIDAIQASMSRAGFQDYLKGTTIKYLWRYREKSEPLQDLKKAQWFLERLILEESKSRNR